MSDIHPAAHVSPKAVIGENVCIGPGAFVGPGVELGEGCEVGTGAVIEGPAKLGAHCRVFPGALVGLEAQVTAPEGKGGRLEIGPRTVVRELGTVHRSMFEEGTTRVGADCYVMACAHVAHDCVLGDRVILVNHAALSGHVEIADDCFVSGFAAFHQFVCVGEGVLVGGACIVRKDVPPFVLIDENPPRVRGLNVVGLRRRGVPADVRGHIKRAYQILFDESATVDEACRRIEAELPLGRELRSMLEFLGRSKRGVYRGNV